jgi:hypothetical protein
VHRILIRKIGELILRRIALGELFMLYLGLATYSFELAIELLPLFEHNAGDTTAKGDKASKEKVLV